MRDSRRLWAWLIAAGIAVLAAVYYFFDPMQSRWMPRCLWKAATGTDCPGCGSQRMAHALLHGDLAGAWRANAYALCLLPFIVFLIWLEFNRNRYPALYMRVHRPWVMVFLAVTLIAWWIVRNTSIIG